MKLTLYETCSHCQGRGWCWHALEINLGIGEGSGPAWGWFGCLCCNRTGTVLSEDGKEITAFLADLYGLTVVPLANKHKPDYIPE